MNIFSTIYYYARAILAIIGLNRNPERTDLVFVVAGSLLKLGKFQELHRIVGSSPDVLKTIKEKKLLKIAIKELTQFPVGTLGKTYADHMVSLNLNPDFFPYPKELNDETYILLRMRQTHDLWHVATGFDTSILGEISLQSFMLAQVASPVSILIVGSSILRCAFKNQERLFPMMDGVSNAWKMGKAAAPLFPYDWENAWNKSLQEVRQELRIP